MIIEPEFRKRIARIISPKASLEDIEDVIETKFQSDRRRVAYKKADAVISAILSALSQSKGE